MATYRHRPGTSVGNRYLTGPMIRASCRHADPDPGDRAPDPPPVRGTGRGCPLRHQPGPRGDALHRRSHDPLDGGLLACRRRLARPLAAAWLRPAGGRRARERPLHRSGEPLVSVRLARAGARLPVRPRRVGARLRHRGGGRRARLGVRARGRPARLDQPHRSRQRRLDPRRHQARRDASWRDGAARAPGARLRDRPRLTGRRRRG